MVIAGTTEYILFETLVNISDYSFEDGRYKSHELSFEKISF